MSTKVECKSKKCTSMILASTAEKTGGICMPCKQKADRLKYEEFVRKNKQNINLFEGVTDPVEILIIMQQPKKYDPLISYLPYKKSAAEIYENLCKDDIERLIKFACDNIDTDNKEMALNLIYEIAAFTDVNITKIHKKLIEMHEYYPGHIFRGADNDIEFELIARIECITKSNNFKLEVNHILEALSWIGTDSVTLQFSKWKQNPPKWSKKMHIPPEAYAQFSGWELDSNFQRRDLILERCYPLIDSSNNTDTIPIETCTEGSESCQWCGRTITNIFVFNLADDLLNFIPVNGTKLTIATCEVCCTYGENLFMHVGHHGESNWASFNVKPDYLPDVDEEYDRLPTNKLRLSTKPRLIHHSVNWCLPSNFSQVGGHPSWIQDAEYGKCPKCDKGMQFIAQLSVEDIDQYGEGIFYGLLCPDCMISTVRYQQT